MAKGKNSIEVRVSANTTQFSQGMQRAQNSITDFGKKVGAGLAVGAGAVAAFTAKGLSDFASFQTGMNEVFTLLPGESQAAFDKLTDQTKDFSKEFGVLPNDVIPSLYQALSAGVPQDNVFEFLETAQMAAKGGVTSLETAVDGISSVVNAYGDDVISATEASDLMFTAVRLGKTNFEELSGSLFQVAPIASSLGVNFDTVTAALANLTAKGTPTSVAATQMKGALSELGKEGSKADKAFRDLTGMGFTDFLETEGNVVSAFTTLAEGAEQSGKSVLDMFGSIEAGQAVLSLTADGGEAFLETLQEMGDSAGATETAFETMDTGLQASLDRIKAALSVLFIDVGEKLAPVVEAALDKIIGAWNAVSAAYEEDGFAGVFDLLQEQIAEHGPKVLAKLSGWLEDVGVWFVTTALPWLGEKTLVLLEALWNWVSTDGVETLGKLWDWVKSVGTWFIDEGLPWLGEKTAELADALWNWIQTDGVDTIAKLWDWIESLGTWFIDEGIPYISEKAGELAAGLIDWIQTDAVDAISAATDWINSLGDWIKNDAADVISEKTEELGEKLWEWLNSEEQNSETIDAAKEALGTFANAFATEFLPALGKALIESNILTVKAFGNLFKGFFKQLGEAAANDFASAFTGGVSKKVRGIATFGIPGAISDAAGFIGGLFSEDPVPLTGRVPGRAAGGLVKGGMPYMIGEQGPEMFVPSVSGTVVPNNKLRAGSGSQQQINVTVNAGIGTDGTQVGRQIVQVLNEYAANGGSRLSSDLVA